uniref:EGF-like domain-containing protein n=1 Tax=Branchiostoma floridae TaxID=7739 RepID=C3YG80_BRAFL|eukprot:XP_002604590.1 hypothetical protein BRAFLDRAFT_92813 [Branchiostoma floridae]
MNSFFKRPVSFGVFFFFIVVVAVENGRALAGEVDGDAGGKSAPRQARNAVPPSGLPPTRFTPDEIHQVVAVHNNLRSSVTPGAANMQYMKWHDELAAMSQAWADKCEFEHGQVDVESPPYGQIGQNLWKGSPRMSRSPQPIQDWYGEVVDYHFDTLHCNEGRECGHYTQERSVSLGKVNRTLTSLVMSTFEAVTSFLLEVSTERNEIYKLRFDIGTTIPLVCSSESIRQAVGSRSNNESAARAMTMGLGMAPSGKVVWAETNRVGCGVMECDGFTIIVCNYGPIGNHQGVPPYKVGTACTKCASGAGWCDHGLCVDCQDGDCECPLVCQNCGELDTDTCTCSCKDGWDGLDCADLCNNTYAGCYENPGYPQAACSRLSMLQTGCREMCGYCESLFGMYADECFATLKNIFPTAFASEDSGNTCCGGKICHNGGVLDTVNDCTCTCMNGFHGENCRFMASKRNRCFIHVGVTTRCTSARHVQFHWFCFRKVLVIKQ